MEIVIYIVGLIVGFMLATLTNTEAERTTTTICTEVNWQSPTCDAEKQKRLKAAGLITTEKGKP